MTLLNHRKANQKILELESELIRQREINSNELKMKVTELQNQLHCEQVIQSLDIEEKNTTISDKGILKVIIKILCSCS